MKLLSKALVAEEYVNFLRADIDRASICRFVIGYVSSRGLNAIGESRLCRVLSHPQSFGVSSLTCSCGHGPLSDLQRRLTGIEDARLKYFMDPGLRESGDVDHLSLLHSKLVYLFLPNEKKSVVYIGSHNWTGRTLGPHSPRNVEASLRFECDFMPGDLDGKDASIASEVNRHLLSVWDLPLCLPATKESEATFRDWELISCPRMRPDYGPSLEDQSILLAVLKGSSAGSEPLNWRQLTTGGLYLQCLDEEEGSVIYNASNRVLVLVWDSEKALEQAHQPTILVCQKSTFNAGPNSRIRGTNTAQNPIAGYSGVIFDETELNATLRGQERKRPKVQIWSGALVEVFDIEYPTQRNSSHQVDGTAVPRYQFHLEVRAVVPPRQDPLSEATGYGWQLNELAFAAGRNQARVQFPQGYRVTSEQEGAILGCLKKVFNLSDPRRVKIGPCSKPPDSKIGMRLAAHPLHETFLGNESRSLPGHLLSFGAEWHHRCGFEWRMG